MDGSPGISDPLVLSASGVISPGGGGSLNTGALANPHSVPMAVREIRFRIFPESDTNTQFFAMTGQGVGVKMDLGEIGIVDADTPISMFGSGRELSEFGNSVFPTVNNVVLNTVTVQPCVYWWRPKYPIIVPPGKTLSPVFSHLGQINYGVNVDVAYIASTMDKMPKAAMYPWVSAFSFQSAQFVNGAVAYNDTSTETKLNNPFEAEMEVAKLVGHVSMINNSSFIGGGGTNYAIEELFDMRSRLMTLRIRSSKGEDVVRTPLAIDTLFPYGWCAWELGAGRWHMKPGEYYRAQLNVAAMDFNPPAASLGQVQFSMGLVGYRKVKYGGAK